MVSRKKCCKCSAASRKKARKKRGTARSKLSLRLLVDTKSQRVLYADAGKDVVDFLFSLLAFPLGTVASLLTPAGSMVASVGNLYDSYMCGGDAKAALLTPTSGSGKLRQLLKEVAVAREGSEYAAAAGLVQGVVTYTVMDVFIGRKKKKRKAREAFRHEALPRVVRSCHAWTGPWRSSWFAPCQLHGAFRTSR